MLMRIAGELDRQQQEAQRAGALVLASLIGVAIVETKAQLATC